MATLGLRRPRGRAERWSSRPLRDVSRHPASCRRCRRPAGRSRSESPSALDGHRGSTATCVAGQGLELCAPLRASQTRTVPSSARRRSRSQRRRRSMVALAYSPTLVRRASTRPGRMGAATARPRRQLRPADRPALAEDRARREARQARSRRLARPARLSPIGRRARLRSGRCCSRSTLFRLTRSATIPRPRTASATLEGDRDQAAQAVGCALGTLSFDSTRAAAGVERGARAARSSVSRQLSARLQLVAPRGGEPLPPARLLSAVGAGGELRVHAAPTRGVSPSSTFAAEPRATAC